MTRRIGFVIGVFNWCAILQSRQRFCTSHSFPDSKGCEKNTDRRYFLFCFSKSSDSFVMKCNKATTELKTEYVIYLVQPSRSHVKVYKEKCYLWGSQEHESFFEQSTLPLPPQKIPCIITEICEDFLFKFYVESETNRGHLLNGTRC